MHRLAWPHVLVAAAVFASATGGDAFVSLREDEASARPEPFDVIDVNQRLQGHGLSDMRTRPDISCSNPIEDFDGY
jgi:hypothetical protein